LRRRLQLGEWLGSFLVAVGAGHGSAEVVLLAALPPGVAVAALPPGVAAG